MHKITFDTFIICYKKEEVFSWKTKSHKGRLEEYEFGKLKSGLP